VSNFFALECDVRQGGVLSGDVPDNDLPDTGYRIVAGYRIVQLLEVV